MIMRVYITRTADGRGLETNLGDHAVRATLLDFVYAGNGEISAVLLLADGTFTTRPLTQICPADVYEEKRAKPREDAGYPDEGD